jgi:hypothetical protein
VPRIVYRYLRTVEYPNLFVGHCIVYALLWARQTSRGLLVALERVKLVTLEIQLLDTNTCADTCFLSFYGSYGLQTIIIIDTGQATRRQLILTCLPKPSFELFFPFSSP